MRDACRGAFPVSRFPSRRVSRGGNRLVLVAQLVSVAVVNDVAGFGELSEGVADGLGAHFGGLADASSGEGSSCVSQDVSDAFARVCGGSAVGGGVGFGDAQGGSLASDGDLEGEVAEIGGGAVVGCEQDSVALSSHDQDVVAPGEDLAAAAQGLSGSRAAAFSGVMDDEDGGVEGALDAAQAIEDGSDLADGVLVGSVQAHERVENQQARPDALDGAFEAATVLGIIEAQGRHVEDAEVEALEVGSACGGDGLKALAEDMGRVLGCEQEDAAGLGGEAPHAGDAGGDGDGDVEGEEGLAALRLAADDADALLVPERVDEPGLGRGADLEFARRAGREVVHRVDRARFAGGWRTSK